MNDKKRLKVLVLSRNYPNTSMPLLGLWIEQWARHVARHADVRVIAPVPYCPPVPRSMSISRFRAIAKSERIGGLEVAHPRFPTGPGYFLHPMESRLWTWSLGKHVERLRESFPFDVIHAHFSYPDGAVAVELGERYGVPVVITEHARWRPWMDQYPSVLRIVRRACAKAAFHTGVSRFVLDLIRQFTGPSPRQLVTHLGVDGSVFVPPETPGERDPESLVYVGRLHLVKGVDVLLKTMAALVKRRPRLKLSMIGGDFYRATSKEVAFMRQLADDLGLGNNVEFLGPKPREEVAAAVRKSALLVLPSRSETFGAVLVEALACGTPVVATRCGGPEDIVTDEVGRLVQKEDPKALQAGIEAVLDTPEAYPVERLRRYALDGFAWERVATRTMELYERAVAGDLPE